MTSGDESWCWKPNRTQHEMAWNLAYRYRKVSTLCNPLLISSPKHVTLLRHTVTSRCSLRIPQSSLIELTENDKQKAKGLLSRPYMCAEPDWKHQVSISQLRGFLSLNLLETLEWCGVQIELLLRLEKKAEIQCLSSISTSYLIDVYLPNKIKYGGWIWIEITWFCIARTTYTVMFTQW